MKNSFIVLVATITLLEAQEVVPRTTLTGRVVDDSTGAPLLMANVFIAGSLIGTTSDEDGRFQIKGVPFGNIEVVASLIGHKPRSIPIRLMSDSYADLEFRLRPSLIQLKPVIIDASEWMKNLKKFKELFFGYSRNAKECRLINSEAIEFGPGEAEGSLLVEFSEPLIIENRSLGFKLTYFMDEFTMHGNYVQFAGITHYEELNPIDEDQQQDWFKARKKAYKGSLQHFLAALVKGELDAEGFMAYHVPNVSLTNRLRKSVETDSVLTPTEMAFEKHLSFKEFIEVIYRGERSEPEFKNFLHPQGASPRYTNLLRNQVSWITLNKGTLRVNVDGIMSDPYAIMTFGYWSYERVGEMLPLEYKPPPE